MEPILLQHLGATEEAMVEDPVVLEVINQHFVQLKPFDKYFDMLFKTQVATHGAMEEHAMTEGIEEKCERETQICHEV